MNEGSDGLHSDEQKDAKWSKIGGKIPHQKTVRAVRQGFPDRKPMKEGSDGLYSDKQKDSKWSKMGG